MQWPPAAAGLEHVHPWVVVGQVDQLTHVDFKVIAYKRELIGKSDVHIAKAVLGELYQLSCSSRGGEQLTLAEAGIESLASGSGCGGKATDHPVVADQLLEDATGEHPLRAVGDVELLAAQAARISDYLGQVLRGTHR